MLEIPSLTPSPQDTPRPRPTHQLHHVRSAEVAAALMACTDDEYRILQVLCREGHTIPEAACLLGQSPAAVYELYQAALRRVCRALAGRPGRCCHGPAGRVARRRFGCTRGRDGADGLHRQRGAPCGRRGSTTRDNAAGHGTRHQDRPLLRSCRSTCRRPPSGCGSRRRIWRRPAGCRWRPWTQTPARRWRSNTRGSTGRD
jgi:hypothetical protein